MYCICSHTISLTLVNQYLFQTHFLNSGRGESEHIVGAAHRRPSIQIDGYVHSGFIQSLCRVECCLSSKRSKRLAVLPFIIHSTDA